jgi:hypothetical protein
MQKPWTVELTSEAEKALRADFTAGKITVDDVKVIKRWIADLEEQGLEYTQNKKDWRDHELSGNGVGTELFRSRTQAESFIASKMKKSSYALLGLQRTMIIKSKGGRIYGQEND